ncbi:hypothetical protein GCM10027416_10370 [Okibacterium endophyticum]
MAVSASDRQAGDDSVEKATGRSRDQWRSLLGSSGAATWSHTATASWLVDEHGVDGWWAQSITVDFEQHIGRRKPGQRADGTFEVSVSRTVPLEQRPALDAAIASVTSGVGSDPVAVNTGGKHINARWNLDDGRALLAAVQPSKNGRSAVSLTLSKITDESTLADAKAMLKEFSASCG